MQKDVVELSDLMRRRMHIMQHRANLLDHVQNTNSQYNLGPFPQKDIV